MKEKVDNVFNVLRRIPVKTYVSMVMVIIVLVNYGLTMMGKPIISFPEEDVTYAVNMVLNIVFIGFAAWENNSATENAIMADKILFYLRDGRITKEELEKFISEHKNPDVPTE